MEKIKNFSDRFKPFEKTWVNDLLWYHTEPEKLFIHLADAGDRPLMQTARTYEQGLSELAEKMKSDPELQDKNFVIAISWIVKNNPNLLKGRGFTVFDSGNERENIDQMEKAGITGMKRGMTKKTEAVAAISREDFISRYGSKNQNPDAEASGRANERTKGTNE